MNVPDDLARALRRWFKQAVLEEGDEHAALHAIAEAARPGTGVVRMPSGQPMVCFTAKGQGSALSVVVKRLMAAGETLEDILQGVRDAAAAAGGVAEVTTLTDAERRLIEKCKLSPAKVAAGMTAARPGKAKVSGPLRLSDDEVRALPVRVRPERHQSDARGSQR